jgi:hypothetical protein
MTLPDGEHTPTFSNQTLDLRELDLPGFRRWLEFQFERWERDPVFNQRCRIRDLRRASPRCANTRRRLPARRPRSTPPGHISLRLAELDQEIANADKAIAGLTRRGGEHPPGQGGPPPGETGILPGCTPRMGERAIVIGSGIARPSGPDPGAGRVGPLQGGHRVGPGGRPTSTSSKRAGDVERVGPGSRLSGVAEETTRDRIVSMILPPVGDGSAAFQILRQVRLGAAEIELDLVVVRKGESAADPVEVLAVVEAKRNINDVGHGFLRRQANLAWLTGDRSGYDPAARRTRTFPHRSLRPPDDTPGRQRPLPVRADVIPPVRPGSRIRVLPGRPLSDHPPWAGMGGVGFRSWPGSQRGSRRTNPGIWPTRPNSLRCSRGPGRSPGRSKPRTSSVSIPPARSDHGS